MKNENIPLLPNNVYHICAHAVNNNNFFTENENYWFFLKRYQKFIPFIADTYTYCLLPNHFHLAVKIKTQEELLMYFNEPETCEVFKTSQVLADELPHLLSYQFSHLFNSYTKSFNKMYSRKGSLFERGFSRYLVSDRTYFKTVIKYILANPVHHGFTNNFKDWAFSAYWEMVFEEQSTFLKRDTVFNVFGSKDHFIKELEEYAKGKNNDLFE